MDVVRRPKDAFLMGSEFSSTNLDRAGHFGPVHGSNRRRSGKQLITLDLNHFGFRGRGGQRGGEKRKKKEVNKEGGSGPTHSLNGGELDKEPALNSVGQQGDIIKGGWPMKVLGSRTVLNDGREKEHSSSAEPKWWRAGQRTFSPQCWSAV